MKALTICQPWAELIARGVKRVENRTWPTRYRGMLAIHAGKSRDWLTQDAVYHVEKCGHEFPREEEMTFGAIVAVAELADCVRVDELPEGHPFTSGPFCWLLKDVRRVGPFVCSGKQGLWVPPADFVCTFDKLEDIPWEAGGPQERVLGRIDLDLSKFEPRPFVRGE